jgi:CDP-glucose 4,6-dehydratase
MNLRPETVLSAYRSRRVLVTGHTGFKGSWMTAWLAGLGAKVSGLSLPPDQGDDNLFERADIANCCNSHIGDIRNFSTVRGVIEAEQPQVVFHLAAQPLVRRSYDDPLETISTNVLGTACVLEAARLSGSVNAVVCVTTDKVYRNHEWPWPYRETDELGGHDPYSASKAAAEMIARSYRTALAPKDRAFALATVRGGNVVGGGDWSIDRLIPDLVRALRDDVPLAIRHPDAVRPWQHVLDLCYAYLLIGEVLVQHDSVAAVDAWNIGPAADVTIPVRQLVTQFLDSWNAPKHPVVVTPSSRPESQVLSLDSSRARSLLGWRPALNQLKTIRMTSEWYRAYLQRPNSARALLDAQAQEFQRHLIDQEG